MKNDGKILSLFLGPKAENAGYLEELLLLVLRDYFHWRRNYFPGDKILLTKELQRELEHYYDQIYQNTLELTAELRRNFPFYSSRYIAHQLSDTLMPSMIGYLAGMLYNPNNVTPEAAPVTVDMEIEACNVILEMLGYAPPPDVPVEFSTSSINDYKKQLQKEFGWAHLTLGGTTANLEALWVARTVKYTPLSIWDVCKQEGLNIEVKHPNGSQKDIKKFTRLEILSIKSNESIYLLAKYVDAIRLKNNISIQEAGSKAHSLLKDSKYSLNKGLGKVFNEFPPVIFVSGMAHYSINKAVDILGIGKDNIELVKADSQYRIDVKDLEKKIQFALSEQRIPLAVVSIVGTTEEGSVDPVHHIQDLREQFEREFNISFWLHVDAAWGGYIKSLFNLSPSDNLSAILTNISSELNFNPTDDLLAWNCKFFEYVERNIIDFVTNKTLGDQEDGSSINLVDQLQEDINREIRSANERLNNLANSGDLELYLRTLSKFVNNQQELGLQKVRTTLSLEDRINLVNNFVSDEVVINWEDYQKNILMQWGSKDVCSSLMAISKADSITIDPHKMGYVQYPCGMIAFKNDRVRHFILQKAPYITSVRQDILVHMPPKHLENIETSPKIVTEAFAPFIVEGSRPGAAASSLWTTVKTIRPTMTEAGAIVRSSLLAARELYEWLVHWATIMKFNKEDVDFDFIPLTLLPPDTNIVVFSVKKKTSNSLSKMNELSRLVYEKFSIQSELGEREFSYAQPFFLSNTTFQEPNYPFDIVKPVLERYFDKGYSAQLLQSYKSEGITVLRATVMNPYTHITRKLSGQDILKEFMQELHTTAKRSVKEI